MSYDFDLFVIGGGSGGVRASRMAAMSGARVAIAEEYAFGGTCVIRGCIPMKLFVYAAQFGEDFEDASGFGWTVPEKHFDWNVLVGNKNKEIARLSDIYRTNVVKAGVEIIDDRAEFEGPHAIRLKKSGRTVTAERILIATGGRPTKALGELPGWRATITSNEAFYLPKLPRRIVVVGGGYIAVEFAHIFHGLGCDVTLVYRGEKVLRGFDMDMRDALCDSMHKTGLRVVTNRNFTRIDKRGDTLFAATDHGEIIETDAVMLAVGRVPNTGGMGLDKAGVMLGEKGEVKVDDHSQTSVPHIHAIGDVTDRLALTPVAIHEAMCFWNTVYNGKPDQSGSSRRADGGVQPPGDRHGGAFRRRRAGGGACDRCLQIQLPPAQAHHVRPRRARVVQTGGGFHDGQSARLPHLRLRRGRDHPGRCGGDEDGCNQSTIRFHHRATPQRRGGTGHDAHEVLFQGAGMKIDLLDPASFASGHPLAQYRWLQQNAPVFWHEEPDGKGFWAVTRHKDVWDVDRDFQSFSSEPTIMIADPMMEQAGAFGPYQR